MKQFPRRSIMWIMMFTCTFFNYMIRVNMSILIVAMAQSDENITKSIPVCINEVTARSIFGFSKEPIVTPDYGEKYHWSREMQGEILASFYWGVIITSIPGGFLAERYGAKAVIRVSTLASVALTHLTPVMAELNFYALIAVRFIFGLMAGVVYPALHWLISRWVVPNEKSIFVSALLGASLGITFTWPFLGIFISSYGWKWGFHAGGLITLVWWVTWEIFVTNTPVTNKFLTMQEKDFLMNNIIGLSKEKKRKLPIKDILRSPAFWAYVILHFGNLYGIFFMMTSAAIFMSTVLGYNLQNTGILIAIPYIIRVAIGMCFGVIGDTLLRKNIMSRTNIRKSFTFFSHFIPGFCLLAMVFTGCDVNWAMVLSIIIVGISGASTITNFQNNQDLSPNYTSTLYGLANCIACCSGFISPTVVGFITRNKNGLDQWHLIFLLTASIFILSAMFFLFFGSGEVQPWNDQQSPLEEEGS